jgi:hypothetical protein
MMIRSVVALLAFASLVVLLATDQVAWAVVPLVGYIFWLFLRDALDRRARIRQMPAFREVEIEPR